MGRILIMSYRMPKKMEDEYENSHGFRSSDMRPFGIIMVIMVFIALFFVKGIILKGIFLLFVGFLTYYLLLPNKKGRHGASKNVRNWQIYFNYIFKDKHTYKPKGLEDNHEI